ncbi:hypothetical protein MTR67_043273 [Solanum verrucosum]|uniref:Uncharacterized protein n=1 Tax=Solanum verrucosum TaxID=315347 RepID=A0AAF0UR03_SOLVR|nr:hypothetical protein MTR67_043273 [Solanum verrucosum]
MVADALNRLSMGSVAYVDDDTKDLVRDLNRWDYLDFKAKQDLDPILVDLKKLVSKKSIVDFSQRVMVISNIEVGYVF